MLNPASPSTGDRRGAARANQRRRSGRCLPRLLLQSEWDQVVDAWQLETWEAYRDVVRLGRKTRLPEAQRSILWAIFSRVWADLHARKLITAAQMFSTLAATMANSQRRVFDYAVIDEAQDLSVSHLRFLAALGAHQSNALFFAGDLGQRIFQQPFSWKGLGVDVRGRSRTPAPRTRSACAQTAMRRLRDDGLQAHELAVFVRSAAQLERAIAAVSKAGMAFKVLDEQVESISGHVSISTVHLAKGLEFRAVAVMACDDDIVPLQARIETVGDDADLREVYETERHLLYVACTRARDQLLLTAVAPASEFLDDM